MSEKSPDPNSKDKYQNTHFIKVAHISPTGVQLQGRLLKQALAILRKTSFHLTVIVSRPKGKSHPRMRP